ncbi:MAG: UDP-N-acetylmuramoyl-L-alanyl-D-glutamate--2,6-diaminopimelate ligase [Thermodesulfovibrionales bacterium]|nr:UDP-N-acetylmuramoyl-L-alanyl-D-glutamate--2,6-diaminopimelate ligase [Thermodesulfovibrionales bacterium]
MKIGRDRFANFRFLNNIELDIEGISYDSRTVKEKNLFVAIEGENFDGHTFIKEAILKGATAVVFEKGKSDPNLIQKYPHIAWIEVEDSRLALAQLSSSFYHYPSQKLNLIGITGTNGKTTTSYLIRHLLISSGRNVGLIGTLGYYVKNSFYPSIHTTPEAPDFQAYLRKMLDEGCEYVISEVSSHALAQKRVDCSRFKIAVFTNLTQDHLDFHKTMEAYYQAKKRLFSDLLIDGGIAVINIDDFYGSRLMDELKTERGSNLQYITIGIKNPKATIRAKDTRVSFSGISFRIESSYEEPQLESLFSSKLIGIPNVYNIISAIAVGLSLGFNFQYLKKAVEEFSPVEGRFQKVDVGQDFIAIVDYAHTEDALKGLLNTARELLILSPSKSKKSAKIITVFGCGGNRDKSKRPAMAKVATELSDFVIITSDNPRFEDPMDIISDIEKGVTTKNYLIIPDRKLAINMAVREASRGDVLLVAGKGHENYQEVKGVRLPFSDKLELEKAIQQR